MTLIDSNNNRPTISLQSISNRGLKNFRKVLKSELTDFENKQRLHDPYFDVYEWVAEHLNYGTGGTIRKWLNENDQTGTKMGIEDLKFICLLLNTPRPADAYVYDIHLLFESRVTPVNKELIRSIEKGGLKVSSTVGQLCNDIDAAFDDGILQSHERDQVLRDIENSIEKLKLLKQKVTESR